MLYLKYPSNFFICSFKNLLKNPKILKNKNIPKNNDKIKKLIPEFTKRKFVESP